MTWFLGTLMRTTGSQLGLGGEPRWLRVTLAKPGSPGPSAQSLVRTTVTRDYRSTRGDDRDRRNTQPGEPARVDYIEFVPVSVAPLAGAGRKIIL